MKDWSWFNATTKDYRDFILEQLNSLDNITCKSMMGEYLLYYNGILFGGIYDDRLLVKIVDSNKKYNMQETIPYESAKPMYLVDDVDNQETIRDIVLDTCKGLKWGFMDIRKSKNITTITLVMVFTLCFILGIIRWINIFNENVFVITKEINSHITNFTISLMLCTLIGYLLLCYRKKYSTIIIIGLILISTNLIYETILPFINTIDLIDAVYGILGVIISLIYLLFIDKKGFDN